MRITKILKESEAQAFNAELTKEGFDQEWTPADKNGMIAVTYPAVEFAGKQLDADHEPSGLKDCPFCGKEPELRYYLGPVFGISCTYCGYELPARDSIEEAADYWNGRHGT